MFEFKKWKLTIKLPCTGVFFEFYLQLPMNLVLKLTNLIWTKEMKENIDGLVTSETTTGANTGVPNADGHITHKIKYIPFHREQHLQ